MGFLWKGLCVLLLSVCSVSGISGRAEAYVLESSVEIEDDVPFVTVGSGGTLQLDALVTDNFERAPPHRATWSGEAGITVAGLPGAYPALAALVSAPVVTVDTDFVVSVRVGFQRDLMDENWELAVSTDTIIVRVLASTRSSETEVRAFQTQRVDAVMQEQPDLASVFDSAAGPSLTVSTMGDALALSFGQGGPVWAELRGNRSELSGGASSYVLGSVGTHWQVSEGVVLGLMAMADRMETESITGTGWLAGPYAVFRAAGQPLVFQARYLLGDSTNRLADGTVYGSRRSLAMLGLSGSVTRGAVEILPSLRVAYGREVSDQIGIGKGLLSPSVLTELTQVETGLAVAFPVDLGAGETRLRLGVADIWSDGGTALDGHRGELSMVLRHRTEAGGELTLRLARDGLGMAGFKATRAAVNFSMPF